MELKNKKVIVGLALAGVGLIASEIKKKRKVDELTKRGVVGNDLAVFLMIILTIPVFFVVFYEKDGLPCEKYLRYVYLHEKYQPKVRVSKEKLIQMREEEQDINGKKSGPAKKSRKKKKTGRKTSKKGKRVKKGSKRNKKL